MTARQKRLRRSACRGQTPSGQPGEWPQRMLGCQSWRFAPTALALIAMALAEAVPAGTNPSATVAVPPAPTFTAADRRWPRDGRIVFAVTRSEDGLPVGESTHRWTHDGHRYTLTATTETTGLVALFRPARVEQKSTGIFKDNGLRPLRFESLRDGKPKDSVLFDVASARIVLGNGQSGRWVSAAQDQLSLFYQLGLAGLPEPRRVTLATGRKIADCAVRAAADETLALPIGTFGVHRYRIGDEYATETTELWVDIARGLPLKIRHRDRKGQLFDQTATLIEVGKTP